MTIARGDRLFALGLAIGLAGVILLLGYGLTTGELPLRRLTDRSETPVRYWMFMTLFAALAAALAAGLAGVLGGLRRAPLLDAHLRRKLSAAAAPRREPR